MNYAFFRPYIWSFVRHGVVTGAAFLAAKTGIALDEGTINGVSGAVMQGADLGISALVGVAGGAVGSVFSNVPWRNLFAAK